MVYATAHLVTEQLIKLTISKYEGNDRTVV